MRGTSSQATPIRLAARGLLFAMAHRPPKESSVTIHTKTASHRRSRSGNQNKRILWKVRRKNAPRLLFIQARASRSLARLYWTSPAAANCAPMAGAMLGFGRALQPDWLVSRSVGAAHGLFEV